MTSDSDDLEQQLRQNLKLRRELRAEVAKAAKQGGGFAYRLGWVLYWTSLVCIGFWCAYLLMRLQIEGLPRTGGEVTAFDGAFLVGFFVVPALLNLWPGEIVPLRLLWGIVMRRAILVAGVASRVSTDREAR